MADHSPHALHLRPGDRVGSYEVIEQIAAGGTAIVYYGRDTVLGRPVALKQVVCALGHDDVRSAVLRESASHKAAAATDPTHVLQIIEVLDLDRGPIIVTEWIVGPSLEGILDQQTTPMPVKQALGIAAATALGLRSIHAAGLVHRDLKPSNILMPRAGGLKVADFGLAAAVSEAATMSVGSARYLAPEALRGERIDARSDLYSLGLIAYEMLAGRDHFHEAFRSVLRDEKHTAMRWVKWHTNPRAEAPPLSSLAPDIPQPISDLVARMMDKDRNRRVASADELLLAIRNNPALTSTPPEAQTHAPGRPPPRADAAAGRSEAGRVNATSPAASGGGGGGDTAAIPRRRWPAVVAVVVGLLIVVGGVVGLEVVRQQNRAQREAAEQARSVYRDGQGLLKQGDYDAAIAAFEDVLARVPGDSGMAGYARSGILLAEGRALDDGGEHAAALEKFEEVDALGVYDADRVRELMRSARAGLNFDRTVSSVEDHLAAGDLGRAHALLQELTAMTALTAAEQRQVTDLSTRLEDRRARQRRKAVMDEARDLADAGDRDAAIEMLERALARSPHHELSAMLDRLALEARIDTLETRAAAALDENALTDALGVLRELQSIEPTDARARQIRSLQSRVALSRGRELLDAGRVEEAEVALLQSLQYEENPTARALLDNMDQAKRRVALIRAGDQAMAGGEYAQAVGQYEAAVELEPSASLRDKLLDARLSAAIERARTALDNGEIASAREALTEASRLSATDQRVQRLESRIETQGRYLELLAEADAAREESDFGRAKRLYLRAQEVFDSSEVRRRLDLAEYQHLVAQARGYLAAGRFDGAKALLLSAARIQDTPEVRDLLQRLADARAASEG